jgi:hypothetical protein
MSFNRKVDKRKSALLQGIAAGFLHRGRGEGGLIEACVLFCGVPTPGMRAWIAAGSCRA